MNGCGCDANHPTGVQWLVNNGVIDGSWLHADKDWPEYSGFSKGKPANPGHVYVWSTDTIPSPLAHIIADLKTGTGNVEFNVPSGNRQYYLPARTPSPSEGPYYP